jgi:glycosyltransferase involved in cell wall biosynthesis
LLSQFNEELLKKFNIELIISDGGSTDSTVELAKMFPCRILLHDNSKRQTIAEGRNKGAREAKGNILFFINADTYIKDIDTFFVSILRELSNPKTIALTCKVQVFPAEEIWSDKLFHTFHNYYFAAMNLCGIGMGRGECHILRKDDFFAIGSYNEKIIAGEDFELFTRLAKKGKIKFMHSLKIYESPRRYRRYGYIKVMASWFRNCVYIVLFKKSVPGEWDVIR